MTWVSREHDGDGADDSGHHQVSCRSSTGGYCLHSHVKVFRETAATLPRGGLQKNYHPHHAKAVDETTTPQNHHNVKAATLLSSYRRHHKMAG